MEFKSTRYGVCFDGFKAAGIKGSRYGVSLIVSDVICECAQVITKNSVKSGSVVYSSKKVKNGIQAVCANSGNANCCTPTALDDAKTLAENAAEALGIAKENVYFSSTGIIGVPIDTVTVKNLTNQCSLSISSSPKGSIHSAKALMTTDTKIKMYSAEIDGIKIGGICKGAGMIAPNMATMLCYITTNAMFTKNELSKFLTEAVCDSFNMISVDGDMSTNDTVLLLANGKVKADSKKFQALLNHVCMELAKMIARDGEGASKYLKFTVSGAKTEGDAKKCVKALLNSPLVKTAFYGENPNWGRIVSTLGSVLKINWEDVSITFSGGKKSVKIFNKGKVKNIEGARQVLSAQKIKVEVDLGLGVKSASGWGCDLTPEYVRINAGYN